MRSRCRREHDRVDLARSSIAHRLGQGCGIRRGAPAIDDEARDVRPGGGQFGVKTVCSGTVVLHRDAQARDSFVEQKLEDLGRRLGLGNPVGSEPGGLDGAARLRAAGDDPGATEDRDQLVGEPGRISSLDPAT